MISDKKLLSIVEMLLAKAKADLVRWQKDTSLVAMHGEGKAFTVKFKESNFYILYSSPVTEPDWIEVGIETIEHDPIKRITTEEDEDDPRWRLFLDLYQEAERSVLGSDRVLNEIEEELQKEGAIGLS